MSIKNWVLVFISNEPYINKAFDSITLARTNGNWKDDIVLLVSTTLYNDKTIKTKSNDLNIILREVPNRNFDSILNVWRKHPTHSEYNYVLQRGFMFNKFCVFDIYFKQWDIVFYLDAGVQIQGSLDRMKKTCEPNKFLYGHSDSYPNYLWKLKIQFDLELFENKENKKEFIDTYSSFFEKDYFQTTMCIYDTSILEDNTVDRLFELNEKYPIAKRMDQGILNLYFNCEKKLWKQIPIKDKEGFLYDYHERNDYKKNDYLILKISKTN